MNQRYRWYRSLVLAGLLGSAVALFATSQSKVVIPETAAGNQLGGFLTALNSGQRATLRDFFYEGWKHKRIDAELANARNIIPPIKRTYRPGILCVKCHGSDQSSVAYRDITVAARGSCPRNQCGLVNARAVESHRAQPRE